MELIVQSTHPGHIAAMALSDDGRLLATASWDDRGMMRLWDASNALELRRFQGHHGVIHAVDISRNGRFLLTGGSDETARLWDAVTGRELLRLEGHGGRVRAVAISPTGSLLLTGSDDMTVRLWRSTDGHLIREIAGLPGELSSLAVSEDARYALAGSHASAQLLDLERAQEVRRLVGHGGGVSATAISKDGRYGLTGSLDRTVRLWDLKQGTELRQYQGHQEAVSGIAFSDDGAWVAATGEDGTARLWERSTGAERLVLPISRDLPATAIALSPGAELVYAAAGESAHAWSVEERSLALRFDGNSEWVSSVAFSPDGTRLIIGSWDDTGRIWDANIGAQTWVLGHDGDVRAVAFSADGRLVLTGARDDARLWSAEDGTERGRLSSHAAGVRPVAFSPDGRSVLTGSDDKTARLWDRDRGLEQVTVFGPHPDRVAWAGFSPQGNKVVTASGKALYLWNRTTGAEERRFVGHTRLVNSVAFSPDGPRLISASWDNTVRVWDVDSGDEVDALRLTHPDAVYSAVYSPGGQYIATGSDDAVVRLWDAAGGRLLRELRGHGSGVIQVAFSADGRHLLSASKDQTARLWEVASGEELCRLIGFRDGSWAVVDKEGRFDASNGGEVAGLHWVMGVEPIALHQLKERYYEPGLLAKKLGFTTDPLRNVAALAAPKLFPALEIDPIDPADTDLEVRLTNRGGGIGRVTISINGKEVTADARGAAADPNAPQLTVRTSLADHPYLIPGHDNVIEVRAFNAEGFLSSRGTRTIYHPQGAASTPAPTLWAIVVGSSDYEGDTIDLRYAAKDAVDISNAWQLGAKRLFGADHVRLRLLTTADVPGALPSTKADIASAFAATRAAKPWDVLAVYLAGHGLALGDDYYYLTRDARSTDLSDPAVRARAAISGSELTEWLKQSPALKQVMVLDTCAAGQAGLKLVEKRDITSGHVRAIERLKDRTGFHVLMGSAADAVSYEATMYEQGLLTHALLHGMRGPALRQDEYVDVSQLFQHAADLVPTLARNVGGVQRPRIAAPRGASFDIGRLTDVDRRAIPFRAEKPMIVHPVLLNGDALMDDLNLAHMLRTRLRDRTFAAVRGLATPLPLVYVDADAMTGAITPSGIYTVVGDDVKVSLVLARDGERLGQLEIEGQRSDLDVLVASLMEAIIDAVN